MAMRLWLRPVTRSVRSLGARRYWTSSSDLPPPRLDYKAPLSPDAIRSIAELYDERKTIESERNWARHQRNVVGERILKTTQDPKAKMTAVAEAKMLKSKLADLDARMEDVESRLFMLALRVPNDTHPDVPVGPEPTAKILSQHGEAPIEADPQRDHVAVGTTLELLDLETASAVTGNSWYYLLNEGALLEMALTSYALSLAAKRGFKPVTTPDVVRSDIAYRCGFQPRDQEDLSQMYHVSHEHPSSSTRHPELVLVGTAEIPLAGMFADKQFHEEDLPKRVAGLGRAFRAEAGARGVNTRGLYRVHQFTKLELFAVTTDEQSSAMMEEFKNLQTEIFEGLGLTFRVLDMPTEELGASAYRKYDMEAWMPGRGRWGEISSTSNCTDYQARRLHIRYMKNVHNTDPETGKTINAATLPFAHTLNGTAVAVPRLIVTLLENGAILNDEGQAVALNLPKALQPFWVHGLERGIVHWV